MDQFAYGKHASGCNGLKCTGCLPMTDADRTDNIAEQCNECGRMAGDAKPQQAAPEATADDDKAAELAAGCPAREELAACLSGHVPSEAETDCAGEEGNISVDVRLQLYNGGWYLHVGLSDYDVDHRGYWGAASLQPDSGDCLDVADDLIDQAMEQWHSEQW